MSTRLLTVFLGIVLITALTVVVWRHANNSRRTDFNMRVGQNAVVGGFRITLQSINSADHTAHISADPCTGVCPQNPYSADELTLSLNQPEQILLINGATGSAVPSGATVVLSGLTTKSALLSTY